MVPLRALWLALLIVGCAAPVDAPPAPVYQWQEGQAQSHWRYVPLVASEAPYPTAVEFDTVRERCLEAAAGPTTAVAGADPNGADASAADPSGTSTADASTDRDGTERCLASHGFYRALCSDGRDNDGDGWVDHPKDPGCADAHAISESPACDDGRDNDGDGLVDWNGGGVAHPDPDCEDAPSRNSEASPPRKRPYLPF